MLEPVAFGPRCLVHRDWFAGNLLRQPDGRTGIIDFQGAAIGHPHTTWSRCCKTPVVTSPWPRNSAP